MKISNYKIRAITFFICMGIFSLVYQVSASIEPNEEEAILFVEEFAESMNQMDGFGIFIHNTTITLPMFIPGAGFVWGLYSSWETGFAFASLVSVTPGLSNVPPLAILYISPFGFMELVAYSIAISRSFILIKKIVKREKIFQLGKITGIEIGVVIGLLLAGGYLEIYMLELAAQGINFMPQF
jgi:hypothetical protein